MEAETFTGYLHNIFMEDWIGTKGTLDEDFDNWITEQDPAQLVEWGDKFAQILQDKIEI